MPMESANPVVTALEMGLPGLAATLGTGGTSRVVVRADSAGVLGLGNAPQRAVRVASLERPASEQHFITESDSASSQENHGSSADASGGSSHSQSESEEETSAQSESQEEASAQSESQEEVSAPSSEETTKKQKKHKKKSRGAKKGMQSRSDSEEDRAWREDTSWKEGFETSSSPNKGKGKGKAVKRVPFMQNNFEKVKEILGYKTERECDLGGVDPAPYINHYPSSNDPATLVFRRLQRVAGGNPFDSTGELVRTPPAPFVSQNLLATTPRAEGSLPAETSFLDNSVTSPEVSELKQSDEPSTQSQDVQKSVTVLLSEKRKTTILKEAPPGSKIVVNQGEKGLNDANTQLSAYLKRRDVQDAIRDSFGPSYISELTEYDHTRGTNEQQNQNFIQNASHDYNYNRAPTLSTTKATHRAKTNERAAFEIYSLSLDNMDPSVTISNNGTMFDVSFLNEELDVQVVMSMPQSEFDKFGITREDTVSATRDIHRLDRVNIAYNMRCMGIKDAGAYKNFTQVNNANKTASYTSWELMHVVNKASPETVQSPAFIVIVYDALMYNLQSKQFHESIRSLYELHTPIDQALDVSRHETNFNLTRLCSALEEKGVNIGNLRKYNPDLRDVAAFDLNTLTWDNWQKSQLCQSKLDMDTLAIEIKASVTSRGRPRILPTTVTFEQLLNPGPAESSAMGALKAGSSSAPQVQLGITDSPAESSALGALKVGSNSAPQVQLGITDSPVEPSSSAPLEEGNITPSAKK